MYRTVHLFTSQRWSRYQIILLGDRSTYVWTTCLRLLPGSVLVWSWTCTSELPQDYKSDTLPLNYWATLLLLLLKNQSQAQCQLGHEMLATPCYAITKAIASLSHGTLPLTEWIRSLLITAEWAGRTWDENFWSQSQAASNMAVQHANH